MDFLSLIILTVLDYPIICGLLFLIFILNIIRIGNSKKKLKRKKYKKIKPGYFNMGYRFEFNLKGIISIKLRFLDYCEIKGVRHLYYIETVFFGYTKCKSKYIDQKGKVFKRNIKQA